MTNRRSIRRILTLAWVVPACVSIVLSITVFFVAGWFNYHRAVQQQISDLDGRALTVARRLAAEVLLGERGSIESVSGILKSELGLAQVQVTKNTADCSAEQIRSKGFCISNDRGTLGVIRELPLVQDPTYVRISTPAPSYRDSLNLSLLLWIVLPILLIVGLGILGMQKLLQRYVIDPVENLTNIATLGTTPPESWPAELAQLSTDLKDAFLRRDLALVGQISSGVIHDLRTLLHSSWSAAQLAEEQRTGTEKRGQRLEAFLRAAQTNFPKMQGLIQTTLDGSREISINPTASSHVKTIQQSVKAVADFADRSNVSMTIDTSKGLDVVDHDPLQMERALTNLVKNAVEAAAENGSRAGKILVTSLTSAGTTRITIEDSGQGLGFDPNNVLRSVRSTKPHGTGLGLVITRKIVEAHGGQLSAGVSEHLGGARFDIVLPVMERTI